MILTDFIYGFIEDNAGLFVHPRVIGGLSGCTDYVGYPTGICQNLWQSNQPFIFIPAFLLAKLINPTVAYNLIVLGGLTLNFLFALRFFKKLFGRFLASLLAVTFAFSPYFAYQGRSHFDLIQVWPVIWFFDTLFFSQSRHKPVYLGLFLAFIAGISNYLGYFTGLVTGLYLFFSFLATGEKLRVLRTRLPEFAKAGTVFLLTSGVFLLPYIKSNYLSPRVRMEESTDARALNRPFEDFVIFSSRPWYYFLPSVDNPFFGKMSQNILDVLSDTNNYLAQNYFKAEHSASFLGWITILLATLGLLKLGVSRRNSSAGGFLTHNKMENLNSQYSRMPNLPLLLTIVALFTLTMPPSVVINGLEIRTPSYLLFKSFPMFRVLSRMGIVVMLFTLVFSGYGYKTLSDAMLKKRLKLSTVRFVLALLTLFSAAQLYIPVKITHVGKPPSVYSYLGQNDSFKSPIVVYPYAKTNEAFFWLATHNKALINPRYYANKETAFDSETFTDRLKTTRGLEKAKELGAKYLVYFHEADKNQSEEFFNNANILQRISDFPEAGYGEKQTIIRLTDTTVVTLVRIVEAGPAKENSAVLYRFR